MILRRYLKYLFALGLIIHAGTALLRLETFFPFPRVWDFVNYYVGAWALRLGQSPYNTPPEFLARLRDEAALPFLPAGLINPPLWPWLFQPITRLDYAGPVSRHRKWSSDSPNR